MWPTDDQSSRRVRMYKIEILEAVSLGADCCSPGLQRGKATNKQQGHGLPASIRSNRPSCSPVVLFHTPVIPKKTGLAYVDDYHSFRGESLEPAVVVRFPTNLFLTRSHSPVRLRDPRDDARPGTYGLRRRGPCASGLRTARCSWITVCGQRCPPARCSRRLLPGSALRVEPQMPGRGGGAILRDRHVSLPSDPAHRTRRHPTVPGLVLCRQAMQARNSGRPRRKATEGSKRRPRGATELGVCSPPSHQAGVGQSQPTGALLIRDPTQRPSHCTDRLRIGQAGFLGYRDAIPGWPHFHERVALRGARRPAHPRSIRYLGTPLAVWQQGSKRYQTK